MPVVGVHVAGGEGHEQHDDRYLDGDNDAIHERRLRDADVAQATDRGDDGHSGQVDKTAGIHEGTIHHIERSSGQTFRQGSAEVSEETVQVAGPAHGDRGGSEHVFQYQVPANEPGDELT